MADDLKLPRWAWRVEAQKGELAKKCSCCQMVLTYESFHRSRAKSDGHRDECRVCEATYQVKNREKYLAYREKYRVKEGIRPGLYIGDRKSKERMAEFRESGVVTEQPATKDAAARMKAFLKGVDVYGEGED